MKLLNFSIPFILLCLVFSCNTETKSAKNSKPIELIKPDSIVYVISRDGASLLEIPDSTAKTIDEVKFGEKLEIVKDYGTWLAIKRPHFVGSPPVYILKKTTGNELQIPLTNEDLNEAYTEPGHNEDLPVPYKNIEISLVSNAKFYAMKKAAVSHFTADTQKVRKKNGEFGLKIGGTIRKFKDDPESHVYNYLGQFKGLNKYLVQFVWYEAEDSWYELIDKTTGRTNASFGAMPYFTKDRKLVMSLEGNIYDDFADMYVYRVTKDTIESYAQGSFKNWMPADSPDKFWGSDNCFYLPVLPSVVYYQPDTPERRMLPKNYNYRYIRIKIKGPTIIPPEVIPYYPDNSFNKYDILTETLTFEKQINRIDSIRKEIDKNFSSYTKSKLEKYNDTYCYWKGDELQLIESLFKDEKTDNTVRWYYHKGRFISMVQVVRYRDSGNYFADDKYYIYDGKMFAIFKFGKRVAPMWKDYEAVSSNIPETGQRFATEAHK